MGASPIGRWRFLASGLLAATLGMAGCTLALEHPLRCGDGFVDSLAGEACDPEDPAGAHLDACRVGGFGNGDAVCDPDTCQILTDALICSLCGDGMATGDEACDGLDLRGASCPSGVGSPVCDAECNLSFDSCDPCGNGIIEPLAGEECDPGRHCSSSADCSEGFFCEPLSGICTPDSGGVAVPTDCTLLPSLALDLEKPYTSGIATTCTPACLFDRAGCGFCGDGEIDPEYQDIGPLGSFLTRPAELCDADAPPPDDVVTEFCQEVCGDSLFGVDLSCNYECSEDCRGIQLPEELQGAPVGSQELGCCIASGEPCDPNGGFPCCSGSCDLVFVMGSPFTWACGF